jgi:hypothetical protein
MRNTAGVTGGKPIAVLLQYISGVSAINPLGAFYEIMFYFVPDTKRDVSRRLNLEHNKYHSRFTPKGVAETLQILILGTQILPKLLSYEKHHRSDR